MKAQKVFKTNEGTILIVSVSTYGTGGRKYVSVTADEIQPIKRTEAVDQCRESLEDGELWRMAVEAKQTEKGLEDWIETVLSLDGELSGFDNSLYDAEIEIEGEQYLFESRSCGCLHDDISGLTNEFDECISVHLSDKRSDIQKSERFIKSINSQNIDIDEQVRKATLEILELN